MSMESIYPSRRLARGAESNARVIFFFAHFPLNGIVVRTKKKKVGEDSKKDVGEHPAANLRP